MKTILENMAMSPYMRSEAKSRCVKEKLPKEFTVAKCKAFTDIPKQSKVSYMTKEGLGLNTFVLSKVANEMMECGLLAKAFIDNSYISKEEMKNFC